MNKTNKIAIALIIVALSVSNLRAQQPSKGPVIQKEGLIDTLKQHVKTLDELISAINSQGVAFQLSENDLKVNSEFRQAGRYLGKSALDELVDFIRANYRPITINESLQLRRQVAAKIDYLSFAVTYKGETEQAYQFSIRYPGVDNRDFSTGKGCRELLTWNDKWGSRALNFIVTETTAEGVTVSLTDKISPLIESIDEKPEALGSRPQKISFRFDPCFAPHFQFVKGNSDRSLEAYYISEPITVGVLRLFDRKTGARTKIPTNAKDSDPISEIFFDDAEGIAKLIHSDLPSVSQMVNAIKTNVVDLEAGASLAKSSAGRLLEILRKSSADYYPNISPGIFSEIWFENEKHGPAKGYFRVILSADIASPKTKEEQSVPGACNGSTSQEFVGQAWDGLINNLERTFACTDKTIKKWAGQADQQQTNATNHGCTDTPPSSDPKLYFTSYWALSDVATSWFIRGEAFAQQKRWAEAKAAYKVVIDRYHCAFTWDAGRGWFWRTADGAQEKYNDIP